MHYKKSLGVSKPKLQAYGAKEFWIGYNDMSKKGVWQWINPNSSCNNNYTNWNTGKMAASRGRKSVFERKCVETRAAWEQVQLPKREQQGTEW